MSAQCLELADSKESRKVTPAFMKLFWTTTSLDHTFRALKHRNYRLYFIGQLISITGSWMQTTALAWLAFEMTHESKWPALISSAGLVPTLLFGVWGGTLADRHCKRSLILATQVGLLVQALLLVGLLWSGLASPWTLFGVSLLAGMIQAVDFPARLSFVLEMVGREDLMNAVALNALLFNVSRAIGPAIAGGCMYWMGPDVCFLLNAATYFAVIWALLAMRLTARPIVPRASSEHSSIFSGFIYLKRRPELGGVVLLAGLAAMTGWPFLSLLPALSDHQLSGGERGYCFMQSATGVGALVSAWIVASIGSVKHRQAIITLGVMLVLTGLCGLALARVLTEGIVFSALTGIGLISIFATCQSVVQLGTQESNRGQIMGIWAMVISGAIPIGNMIFGPAADRWGEQQILLFQAAVLGCGAGILWACQRHMHRKGR